MDEEFDMSSSIRVETVSTTTSHKGYGWVAKLFIALSFGTIKTAEQADKVMAGTAIVIFLISFYFFLR